MYLSFYIYIYIWYSIRNITITDSLIACLFVVFANTLPLLVLLLHYIHRFFAVIISICGTAGLCVYSLRMGQPDVCVECMLPLLLLRAKVVLHKIINAQE